MTAPAESRGDSSRAAGPRTSAGITGPLPGGPGTVLQVPGLFVQYQSELELRCCVPVRTPMSSAPCGASNMMGKRTV